MGALLLAFAEFVFAAEGSLLRALVAFLAFLVVGVFIAVVSA